jgi:hypothetical protein
MKRMIFSVLPLVAALSLAAACGKVPDAGSGRGAGTDAAWEYPVRLGDTPAKVQGRLGEPEQLPGHEFYAASRRSRWPSTRSPRCSPG